MATEVQEILDRTTKKGRVYYLVRWKGFTSDQDTWESRVDLRQDGHFHHIQVFELKRKQAEDKEFDERNGDAIVPVDAFAEKASRKGRPSKSPSRGRSRSVKRDPSTPRRARSTSRKTKSDSSSDDKAKASAPTVVDLSSTASSTVESSTVVTESIFNSSKSFAETTTTTTVDGTQADDEGDDSDSVFNSSSSAPSIPADVDNSVVSDAVADLVKQGWLVQAVGILVVCLAMLGHILVPHIEANIPMSQEVKTVVLILTKTNSLPPLVTLALVLRGQNNRGLSKWIAICLVWRTAAEVILQLPDPKVTKIIRCRWTLSKPGRSKLVRVLELVLDHGTSVRGCGRHGWARRAWVGSRGEPPRLRRVHTNPVQFRVCAARDVGQPLMSVAPSACAPPSNASPHHVPGDRLFVDELDLGRSVNMLQIGSSKRELLEIAVEGQR
ncbi:hypothetical protein H310_11324 [Aphanomyces invadans]|uniref:Chromo domain-containing protein n=1 Tax=Aphanomyces invadans TaxID=157072 RepID=A0A024TNU1_9STRA|nr:hypothetical protein H310_11324 [Aphanomyces invadans]ETV94997.1 hypothetical protein H310_11324 [Aphanomyces invadans]|eukprot:XP_008876171.1 hypothetical protein H310_11324 [Aphanomyces invadans]